MRSDPPPPGQVTGQGRMPAGGAWRRPAKPPPGRPAKPRPGPDSRGFGAPTKTRASAPAGFVAAQRESCSMEEHVGHSPWSDRDGRWGSALTSAGRELTGERPHGSDCRRRFAPLATHCHMLLDRWPCVALAVSTAACDQAPAPRPKVLERQRRQGPQSRRGVRSARPRRAVAREIWGATAASAARQRRRRHEAEPSVVMGYGRLARRQNT